MENPEIDVEAPLIMKKPIKTKLIKSKKIIDETFNTSYCESISSTSTRRGKNNTSIPKNINKKNGKGETALHIACVNVSV